MAEITDNLGIQGMDGREGTQGLQGSQGLQGPQGSRGAVGAQGLQGRQGAQGAKGAQGAEGAQGIRGCNGIQGLKGANGSTGAQGTKGAQGAQGYRGISGAQGAQGLSGVQGTQGTKGSDGLQGYRGSNGAQGLQGLDGANGIQGSKGSDGSQGLRGASGAQGARGESGSQGLRGENGLQGAQGEAGKRGVQGQKGEDGADGYQGERGTQGSQGTHGINGAQGYQGAKGSDGAQGLMGTKGAQGLRGCNGVQGDSGARGVQGVQGKRGIQGAKGLQGIQGLSGVQGIQGIKGRQGDRGNMGYQGDDGEVGIQGLVGENGAIWDDGVRLSGYNTHSFGYDSDLDKFVPENVTYYDAETAAEYNTEHAAEIEAGTLTPKSAGDIRNTDLLTVRDGSVIRIWLDEASYDKISENDTLPIDTYVNGVATETDYPVYYSGNKPFSDIVVEENDLDTTVEFVYRNGAWYYDGGLKTMTVTEEITVSGVTIGELTDGSVLPVGMTLQEILTLMLCKKVSVKGCAPKVSLSLSGNHVIEVGSDYSGVLTRTVTQGYFMSADTSVYSNDLFDEKNGTTGGKLTAQCADNGTTYYQDNVVLTDNTVSINGVDDRVYTFVCDYHYGTSTNYAKDNQGNEVTSVVISSGTARSNSVTIEGKYKYFYGPQIMINTQDVDDPTKYQFTTQASLSELHSAYLNNNGNTTISSINSIEGKESIVLVIPTGWIITGTKNKQNADVTLSTTWFAQNTIDYVTGSEHTTYQVYVLPSTEVTEYRDIIMTKVING